MRKYLFIPLLLVIFIFVFILNWENKDVTKSNSNNQENVLSPTIVRPGNWKKYENKKLGFSLYLPQNFTIAENGDASILFNPPRGTSPVGQTRFMYVSVVTDRENIDSKVYNYNALIYKKLEAIPDGQSRSVSDLPEQNTWFIYKRLADTKVDNKTAKVYVNANPWEFPKGTTEYRYHVYLPNKLIIVGGYVDSSTSSATLDQQILKSILATFHIL